MKGFYDRYLLPRIVDFTCSRETAMRQREKVVPLANGRVLEVGIGSGLNLPFYDPGRVTKIWGLDPAPEMRRITRRRARGLEIELELLGVSGEEIPLESGSIDSVVVTYTLCTIADPTAALEQMCRVLRPGGQLVFCEHGAAPDAGVRRWQHRINPVWRSLSGGCHLDRDIPGLIEQGGFRVETIETMYLPGWRPASFNYWGRAIPD